MASLKLSQPRGVVYCEDTQLSKDLTLIKLNTMVEEYNIRVQIRKLWSFKEQLIIYVNLFSAKMNQVDL